MIEFDDAGTGCPILGEVYVARRVETNEEITCFVPFDQCNKMFIVAKLKKMLQTLKPFQGEEVVLCRGSVFHAFENVLKKEGYAVKRGEIKGKTNDLAEEVFLHELRKIGLPETVLLTNKEYVHFHGEIMLWYRTFYRGKNVLKPKTKNKPKTLDYVLNRVSHHPHLVAKLFDIETKIERKKDLA